MRTGYIYLLECITTGKKYIGQTVNFEKRKKDKGYKVRRGWITRKQHMKEGLIPAKIGNSKIDVNKF